MPGKGRDCGLDTLGGTIDGALIPGGEALIVGRDSAPSDWDDPGGRLSKCVAKVGEAIVNDAEGAMGVANDRLERSKGFEG